MSEAAKLLGIKFKGHLNLNSNHKMSAAQRLNLQNRVEGDTNSTYSIEPLLISNTYDALSCLKFMIN